MRTRAFTIIELVAVVATAVLLIAILLPPLNTRRCGSRLLNDSTQIRGIMQAMIVSGASNKDCFPLPSTLDLGDATVNEGQAATPELGVKKDISRHIMSLLIFNGYVVPEMLVNPAEANEQIRSYENYEFTTPSHAEGDPAKALWDPAFTATPADENRFGRRAGDKAGFSYAHIPPYDKQKTKWTVSFASTVPVLGDRGPVYSGSATSGWRMLRGSAYGQRSNTALIHGNRDTWEGNVGFADGHVDFLTAPDPPSLAFSFSGLPAVRQERSDCIFANEDDQTGVQLPGNPPSVKANTGPDSGGTYTDPFAGDMSTAYLRPSSKVDWVNNKVMMTAFVD